MNKKIVLKSRHDMPSDDRLVFSLNDLAYTSSFGVAYCRNKKWYRMPDEEEIALGHTFHWIDYE